ncbi:hypothetical protein B0H11DRAFT_2428954 [Mycena galericulata]|nr:hypothetical protein B0H11DRAFT_2428954 [Mycena galericulata]
MRGLIRYPVERKPRVEMIFFLARPCTPLEARFGQDIGCFAGETPFFGPIRPHQDRTYNRICRGPGEMPLWTPRTARDKGCLGRAESARLAYRNIDVRGEVGGVDDLEVGENRIGRRNIRGGHEAQERFGTTLEVSDCLKGKGERAHAGEIEAIAACQEKPIAEAPHLVECSLGFGSAFVVAGSRHLVFSTPGLLIDSSCDAGMNKLVFCSHLQARSLHGGRVKRKIQSPADTYKRVRKVAHAQYWVRHDKWNFCVPLKSLSRIMLNRKFKSFKPRNLPCPFPGCGRFFQNESGRTQRFNSEHARFHQRTTPEMSDNDAPMHSPPGSHASSVLGGGDAGGAITPPPPPTRYHPILNGEVDLRTKKNVRRRRLSDKCLGALYDNQGLVDMIN